MNIERLAKLADFLDALPPEKFDFNYIMHVRPSGNTPQETLTEANPQCGAVGCAIGWTPAAFPNLVRWYVQHNHYSVVPIEIELTDLPENWDDSFRTACWLFEISTDECDYLFLARGGGERPNALREAATPKEVAAHIRSFISEQRFK